MKLLFTASCVTLLLQAPANPLQQQKPQGSIEGTVNRRGAEQPVPNARVTVSLRPAQPGARGGTPPVAIPPVFTDDKGRFTVVGMNEGVYNVLFQANGYVTQRYGRFPTGNGTPVTVTSGQATKDVNVAMTPAASISGRVHDTSDQPLVNVPVELIRSSYDGYGRRGYEGVGTTRTNDREEYRMYWVTPGRYYLRAGDYSYGGSPRYIPAFFNESGRDANASDVPSVAGYAFHPAAMEITNARPIDLQSGADLRSVDVTVATHMQAFSIRGKVIDARTGKAPRTANVFADAQNVGVSPGGGATNIPSPAYKAATGTFEIRNLLPGTYAVVAMVQTPAPPGPQPEPPTTEASGTVTVTVTNSDVNDITLPVAPGATILGRLRIEGELKLNGRPLVMLTAIGGNGGFDQDLEPGFLDADGNFRVNNVVPGEYLFETGNFPINTIGFIKEARFDGADVMSVPLRISSTNNKQLDLVLHVGGGEITGTVTDVRSQPISGARVVLVPDRARFRSDLYRTANTGDTGRFTFARLAPGDYRVLSWEWIEENAWLDPQVLARAESRGVRVHISESSTETVNVQVLPAEGAQ